MYQALVLLATGLGLLLVFKSIRRPKAGIWLLLLLTPLEVLAWDFGANVRLYQPLTILCLLSWLGAVAFFRWPFVLTPVSWAMLAWTLSSIPSILNSPAVGDWLQILFVQIFMLAVVVMVTNSTLIWKHAQKFMNAYLLISVSVAVLALVQALSSRVLGISLGLTERQTAYLEFYNRPSGTFEEPNWLAAYLLVPALFFFTFLFSRKMPPGYKRSSLVVGLFITIMALFMTQTRSSFIGLACGLAAILILNSGHFTVLLKRSVQMAFGVGAAAFLVALIIPEFLAGLDSASNVVGIIMRTNSWSYAWDVGWQHPVIGNGLGAWAHYFSLLEDTSGKVIGGRIVPNAFLGVFLETGLVGLVSFVYLIAVIVWEVLSAIKRLPSDAIEQMWLKAFLAGFIGLMVNFLFTNAIRYGFFWLFVAMGVSMARSIRLSYILPQTSQVLHVDSATGGQTVVTPLQ